MTAPSDVFGDEDVSAVAADRDLEVEALWDALDRLQATLTDLRDPDGLVFEYRKEFDGRTLAGRTDDAYYLLVPEHVWPEISASVDLSAAELAAVRAVHYRTLHAQVDDPDGDGDSLVLLRE